MRKQFLRVSLLAVVAGLFLSGCPSGATQVQPGVWLVEVDEFPSVVYAVRLLPDGTTERPIPLPPGATANFGGVVTWAQVRSKFMLVEEGGNYGRAYTAIVDSRTSLEGEGFSSSPVFFDSGWTGTRVE